MLLRSDGTWPWNLNEGKTPTMTTQLETMHRAMGLLIDAMTQVTRGAPLDAGHVGRGVTTLMLEMSRGQTPMADLNGDSVERLAVAGVTMARCWEEQFEALKGRT